MSMVFIFIRYLILLFFDTTLGSFLNISLLQFIEHHISDKYYYLFESYHVDIKKDS